MDETSQEEKLNEILPKAGIVYSEKGNMTAVLCKPKIMPIKSEMLQKLESLELMENERMAEERKSNQLFMS